MALRKVDNTKQNKGIYAYYTASDKQKIAKAYYVKYRDATGASVLTKLTSFDIKEAREEANTIRANAKQQYRVNKINAETLERAKKAKALTLNQFASMYFDNRKTVNNVQDKAVYESRIAPYLGDLKLKDITQGHVLKMQEELDFAPKTINNTVALLIGMFTKAISKGYLSEAPISRKSSEDEKYIPKLDDTIASARVLNKEELDLLFNTLKIDKRLHLFFNILYYTGVRPAAVIELKVKDYDTEANTLKFKAMKKAKGFTQGVQEKVLKPLLDAYIKDNGLKDNDYIFYSFQGDTKHKHLALSVITKQAKRFNDMLFNKDVTDDRKKVTMYTLRRTAATNFYNAKGLIEASKFLHHTDVRTTAKYLNVDDTIKDAINDVL